MKKQFEIRQRATIRHRDDRADDQAPSDVERGAEDQEQEGEMHERSDLERRVKSWARRSAAWRVQARVGMRRRIAKARNVSIFS